MTDETDISMGAIPHFFEFLVILCYQFYYKIIHYPLYTNQLHFPSKLLYIQYYQIPKLNEALFCQPLKLYINFK